MGWNNMFEPIRRPVISRIKQAPSNLVRNIINLESSANMYYSLDTPWEPSTDYRIEFDIYFTGVTTRPAGNDVNFNSRIIILGSGRLYFFPSHDSDSSLITPINAVPSHKFTNIKVERKGANGEIFINGVSVASGTVPTGDAYINTFNRQFTSYGDGIISNLKLTDLITPSNSLIYRLNNLIAETETSDGNVLTYNNIPTTQAVRDTYTLTYNEWLGTELITQSIWESPGSVGDNWVFNNNKWTLVSDGSYSPLRLIGLTIIDRIRYKGLVDSLTGNPLYTQSASTNGQLLSSGYYSFLSSGYVMEYKRGSGSAGNTVVTISKPSFRRALEVSQ